MTPLGHKLTAEQRERLSNSHKGQKPWNTGMGGCKKGHDPSLYKQTPSGVYVCLGCKRENGAKYRKANKEAILLKNRVGRYGITADLFTEVFEEQDGKCAICKSDITLKTCRIDHNHETGAVRGLLCASCNSAIGLFKDSADVLTSAAEYLRKHDGD